MTRRAARRITREGGHRHAQESAAWRDLGTQALGHGDAEEALWCFRRAVELCSDDPITWQLLGRCFDAIGEETRARRCYTVASRLLLRTGRRSMIRGALTDLAE